MEEAHDDNSLFSVISSDELAVLLKKNSKVTASIDELVDSIAFILKKKATLNQFSSYPDTTLAKSIMRQLQDALLTQRAESGNKLAAKYKALLSLNRASMQESYKAAATYRRRLLKISLIEVNTTMQYVQYTAQQNLTYTYILQITDKLQIIRELDENEDDVSTSRTTTSASYITDTAVTGATTVTLTTTPTTTPTPPPPTTTTGAPPTTTITPTTTTGAPSTTPTTTATATADGVIATASKKRRKGPLTAEEKHIRQEKRLLVESNRKLETGNYVYIIVFQAYVTTFKFGCSSSTPYDLCKPYGRTLGKPAFFRRIFVNGGMKEVNKRYCVRCPPWCNAVVLIHVLLRVNI